MFDYQFLLNKTFSLSVLDCFYALLNNQQKNLFFFKKKKQKIWTPPRPSDIYKFNSIHHDHTPNHAFSESITSSVIISPCFLA